MVSDFSLAVDKASYMNSVFDYHMPTKIVFGTGALDTLPQLLSDVNGTVLVVSTKSMKKLGVLSHVGDLIGHTDILHADPVPPNPLPSTIDQTLSTLRRGDCMAVVGIGGGSAIDVAKSVAILADSDSNTKSYLSGECELKPSRVKCVAIPTTAGSGSEVTPWATVWDGYTKYSLQHSSMFPTVALVDPVLTETLPAYQTAVSGMDALTQAIEAYWSKRSQPISDIYALEAIRKIFGSLEDACTNGRMSSRLDMSAGSLLSGLAFSNTKTTICHSLSYPMTARFGIAHGQAVSITLGSFLAWNATSLEHKIDPLLSAIGVDSVDMAVKKIANLMSEVGLATNLGDLRLTDSDIELILKEGFYSDRAGNNPKPVSLEDARKILMNLK